MNATTTKRQTPVQVRKALASEILTHLSGIARSTLKVGELLQTARATFKDDETKVFLAWSQAQFNLGRSATFQYMQAAQVVADVPEVLDATDSIRTLSYLARFTPDETREVLKAAGKDHTAAGIEAAAVKVIDRVKVAKDKAAEAAETKETETRDSARQAEASIARKIAPALRKALATLDAEAQSDPGAAVRMALLIGAKLGTKSALVPTVLPALIAENDAAGTTED